MLQTVSVVLKMRLLDSDEEVCLEISQTNE